jgi:hypothetical protein
MNKRSPVARLTDIIEAIELIQSDKAGVTLDAFASDRRKRWLVERGIEISRRPVAGCPRHEVPAPGNSVAEGGGDRQRAAACGARQSPPLKTVCVAELAAARQAGK